MFKIVENTTNEALAYVKLHSNKFNEAINFGDLKCVNVVHCKNLHDEEFWAVEIEEADPDCPKLHKYVHKELLRLTGIEVRVVTEW